jgi:Response regulator of the LytR/AlgR family
MELIIRENKEIPLTVTIEYPQYNCYVDKLIKKIRGMGEFIAGCNNGRKYQIKTLDILYIESVDKRTFIYTSDNVFCITEKLNQLEIKLRKYGFVKINRTCLLNMDALDSIKNLVNSKLEAVLINGEKLIVSRTYLNNIKEFLSEKSE